ncbi:M3 family metallopeptidase [Cyanobium sp. Alchichica 3B3-8F6]|uniref:M3 family metallopeptidase n=1 Tax=Cyanobium sp. Alchichica 3B3-8F6 TaxID=2823696 RepID=UPI0020CEF7FE|nr:M3 family metallopeptidase [Cyanobium sp. Alchichica 3B3-8F6]MCP9882557.1 M3 family metallopeptidase [Cyanobium sp. Alchichica 3B3-8F6]
MTVSASLPLLAGQGLPQFEAITPEQVEQGIPALLDALNSELTALETKLEQRLAEATPLAWDELMDPLHHLGERLRWSWGVVSHLNGVCNTPELRTAHQQQQGAVVQFGNRAGQSRPIYRALEALQQNAANLDGTQRRILEAELRDMRLRGVGLEGAEQEAFNAASARQAELATTFSNHVLDATNGWSLTLTSEADLAGLPASLRELLAQAARDAGESGWRLGLDMPRVVPFLKYSQRRDLREQVYRAQVSRASTGELDNHPLIEQILQLKLEQAQRLGYANWAEVSLASKMAGSVAEVEVLLDDLRAAAYPATQQELEALAACAARHGADEAAALKPWDVSYWAEVLRQESFDLDCEALRPWFSLEQVLQGLFGLCQRLFDIRIVAADGEAPVWHSDVRYFRVLDGASGQALAGFYLDPYSRPGSKRGGAWMDECLGRARTHAGEAVLPVAYLICNQSPPVGDTPSLMTFDEVETLFHEFGHGLQHMLTTVERPQAAGINNVEWDAVELPSQFMENWCYDRATLMGMARHWQTGEPLPESDYQKLLAARTFMGGSATLRQVHFALTDLRLHSQWTPACGQSPEQLRLDLARTTTVLEPIPEDAFLCAFSHIFAGGYSAGYYSYKWAEVLSADAFSAFEEVGLEQEEEIVATGRRFRDTVLSLGGSLPPAEVFEAFRGRQPSSEALIRHSGLVAA